MLYKKLGNTSEKIPAIGQGTTGTGGYRDLDHDRVAERVRVLRHGVDLGLTYIDTAELYGCGLAEEVVGKAISGIRDRVFVGSKFCPQDDVQKTIVHSLEGSLRRMKTDYVDLYQMHWRDPFLPATEIAESLSRLVDQGKIRFIGLSNVGLADFLEMQLLLKEKQVVSNQLEYNTRNRTVEDDFLPHCRENGVTLLAYSPLNHGKMWCREDQRETLCGLALKYDKSVAQIILRWLVSSEPTVAVMKAGTMLHTEENAAAMDFDLECDDLCALNEMKGGDIVQVPLSSIRLNVLPERPAYTSIDEAMANPLNLLPSPAALAEDIRRSDTAKPIRLVLTTERSGKYEYDIDGYDAYDNVKRYWAWVLAYGEDRPIPAYVVQSPTVTTGNG